MTNGTSARRDVLKLMAASGAIGLPAGGTVWPGSAHAAGAPAYDPNARFDVAVSEVEVPPTVVGAPAVDGAVDGERAAPPDRAVGIGDVEA